MTVSLKNLFFKREWNCGTWKLDNSDFMRTLVMGDIHGAYKAMVECLGRSNFDPAADTLIQLGDVTDKCPDVYECVETLIEIGMQDKLIALKGNHDDWFLHFITTGCHTENWGHGGQSTIWSYSKKREAPVTDSPARYSGYRTSIVPRDIPFSHQAFFAKQLTHHIDSRNNCFVHAGFNRLLPFGIQNERDYYWDRKLWSDAMEFVVIQENASDTFYMNTPFNEVFIGHTPTTQWRTDQPMHCANVWNLDTGAGCAGRLTIMDTETKEFWQSDPVGYPAHD
jgi:serine/threonine protein phosphatase 1